MAALLRLTSDDRALHFLKLDVSDQESISGAVKALKHETGRLDVLINNAGIILKGSDGILTVSREKLEQIIRVNAVSPGWVRTDMGGSAAPRSVEKGAETPVWMAADPDFLDTGRFYRDKRVVSW